MTTFSSHNKEIIWVQNFEKIKGFKKSLLHDVNKTAVLKEVRNGISIPPKEKRVIENAITESFKYFVFI